jgi:cell division protein ZapA
MAEDPRGNAKTYVTVEIYDQVYHLSGQDADHIRDLATRVDAKMRAVAAQGRTVDSLRVAVLAALNLADELTRAGVSDVQPGDVRAASLRGLLDEVLEEDLKTGSYFGLRFSIGRKRDRVSDLTIMCEPWRVRT